jgi:hypothetical protein
MRANTRAVMNARTRQPLTLSQALGVLAFGYTLVVALAFASDVAINGAFAVHLAVSQLIGVVGYAVLRGAYDS